MRITLAIIALAGIGFTPFTVMADEFGDRFYNQAPGGLGDFDAPAYEIPDIAMDDMATQLQNIMPASGDEEHISESDPVDAVEE